jgi:probable HAF family extracellular repeat protein
VLIRYAYKFFYFFEARKFYLARFVKNNGHRRYEKYVLSLDKNRIYGIIPSNNGRRRKPQVHLRCFSIFGEVMNKKFLCAILVLILIINNFACAYNQVIDLGTLGGSSSVARSINDNGQVIGTATDSAGEFHTCLFDTTGGGANINLNGVSSINNNGQKVGSANNSSGNSHAYLFDNTGSGNNIDLGTLGGSSSYAVFINNKGQIAGMAKDSSEQWRVCLFDPSGNGNNKDLGDGLVHAFNDKGQIVGLAMDFFDYACLFDSSGNGNNIDLGGLVGDGYSEAYSINNNGRIVGEAMNANGIDSACLFDSTGGGDNVDLGSFSDDYVWSYAFAINDKGQIAGTVFDSVERACLFDSTGGGNNIDLNTLIDPSSGWRLNIAWGINNNGWIVGNGINPDGDSHAFLLVVPEPATIVLLTLGGLAVMGPKRRTGEQSIGEQVRKV